MKKLAEWTTTYAIGTIFVIALGVTQGPVAVAKNFGLSEVVVQIPVAIFFLNKTNRILGKRWLTLYILGGCLFIFNIFILKIIKIGLGNVLDYSWFQLILMSPVPLVLGMAFALKMPESRKLILYATTKR
jgi:hypothetical protein